MADTNIANTIGATTSSNSSSAISAYPDPAVGVVNDDTCIASFDAPESHAFVPRGLTLADVGDHLSRRREEDVPESTIGGQTTCIVCMVGPKSHLAVPCGHQVPRGDRTHAV